MFFIQFSTFLCYVFSLFSIGYLLCHISSQYSKENYILFPFPLDILHVFLYFSSLSICLQKAIWGIRRKKFSSRNQVVDPCDHQTTQVALHIKIFWFLLLFFIFTLWLSLSCNIYFHKDLVIAVASQMKSYGFSVN